MKCRIITMVTVAVLLFGCKQPTKNSANVQTIQGLPVFINAEPIMEYSLVGDPIFLEAITSITDSAKNKQGFLNKLEGAVEETVKDMDFAQKLDKMVDKARNLYPDAEAIIFRDRMNTCQAIKFK